MSVVLSRR